MSELRNRMLRDLRRIGLPTVEPVGVVSGRESPEAAEIEPALTSGLQGHCGSCHVTLAGNRREAQILWEHVDAGAISPDDIRVNLDKQDDLEVLEVKIELRLGHNGSVSSVNRRTFYTQFGSWDGLPAHEELAPPIVRTMAM